MSVAVSAESIAAVDEAISSRRSVRAFLPTDVPSATIEDILRVASRAPSGSNIQPWKVTVFTGDALRRMTDDIMRAYNDPQESAQHEEDYAYYPIQWESPYIDRRRKLGWELYGLLGIGKGDKARMHEQLGRNFTFFDAPVGLIFTIDRILELGSWLDYGMFLQNVMVAARARGLHTCPQAAFSKFHKIVMAHADAGDGERLVCGMSLGHEDPDAAENALLSEREPVSGFTRFLT